jgi:hypothetical protein
MDSGVNTSEKSGALHMKVVILYAVRDLHQLLPEKTNLPPQLLLLSHMMTISSIPASSSQAPSSINFRLLLCRRVPPRPKEVLKSPGILSGAFMRAA